MMLVRVNMAQNRSTFLAHIACVHGRYASFIRIKRLLGCIRLKTTQSCDNFCRLLWRRRSGRRSFDLSWRRGVSWNTRKALKTRVSDSNLGWVYFQRDGLSTCMYSLFSKRHLYTHIPHQSNTLGLFVGRKKRKKTRHLELENLSLRLKHLKQLIQRMHTHS